MAACPSRDRATGSAAVASGSVAVASGSAAAPSATPGPSAAASYSAPAPSNSAHDGLALRRLLPLAVTASSEYNRGVERHPGSDGFDGSDSTAWCEGVKGLGNGEWVEAKFAAPQRIRRIRISNGVQSSESSYKNNARAKTLKVIFDGKDDTPQVLTFGADDHFAQREDLDITATTVRFLVDDATKGDKWDDLCISEFAVWGDAGQAPSGGSIGANRAELAATLAELDETWKASSPNPAKWLASIGYSPLQLKNVAYVRANRTILEPQQLDDDPEPEFLVVLSTFNQADAENHILVTDFITIADDEKAGMGILGRLVIPHIHCTPPAAIDSPTPCEKLLDCPQDECKDGICRSYHCADGVCTAGRSKYETADISFAPVHGATPDIVARWESVARCEEGKKGTVGAWIGTVEQGAVRVVADLTSRFELNEDPDAGSTPAESLTISGDQPPKTLTWGKPLTWDPAVNRYR